MENPELKQFGDLTREDFERPPVWTGCHTVDSDEPEVQRDRRRNLPPEPK
jgi:hypothetical protein